MTYVIKLGHTSFINGDLILYVELNHLSLALDFFLRDHHQNLLSVNDIFPTKMRHIDEVFKSYIKV